MKRTKYYKAAHAIFIDTPPYVIAKNQLFTPYEIQRFRLQQYIVTGSLVESIIKNGVFDWYGFRFEKEAD